MTKGFSVLELLIAVLVLSLLSSMSYVAIRQLSETEKVSTAEQVALIETQKALELIATDLKRGKQLPGERKRDGAVIAIELLDGSDFFGKYTGKLSLIEYWVEKGNLYRQKNGGARLGLLAVQGGEITLNELSSPKMKLGVLGYEFGFLHSELGKVTKVVYSDVLRNLASRADLLPDKVSRPGAGVGELYDNNGNAGLNLGGVLEE